MFEDLLSDLGKAFATGLLTGGAFVAIRGLALGSVRQYMSAPRRRPQRDCLGVERRLAAILIVDVVGYSRLMNSDEEGTHARLLNCRIRGSRRGNVEEHCLSRPRIRHFSRLVNQEGVGRRAAPFAKFGRVSAYGTPSTAGRLNPIAIHAPSNFSMNFPEWPG
jgi:hypothetical protein